MFAAPDGLLSQVGAAATLRSHTFSKLFSGPMNRYFSPREAEFRAAVGCEMLRTELSEEGRKRFPKKCAPDPGWLHLPVKAAHQGLRRNEGETDAEHSHDARNVRADGCRPDRGMSACHWPNPERVVGGPRGRVAVGDLPALAWSQDDFLAEPLPYTGEEYSVPEVSFARRCPITDADEPASEPRYRPSMLLYGIAAGFVAAAIGGWCSPLSTPMPCRPQHLRWSFSPPRMRLSPAGRRIRKPGCRSPFGVSGAGEGSRVSGAHHPPVANTLADPVNAPAPTVAPVTPAAPPPPAAEVTAPEVAAPRSPRPWSLRPK